MLLRQMTGALGSTLTSIAFYTIVALFIQLTTGFESNMLDTYTAWHSVKQYLSAPAVDIGVLFLLLVVISGCAALQPDGGSCRQQLEVVASSVEVTVTQAGLSQAHSLHML